MTSKNNLPFTFFSLNFSPKKDAVVILFTHIDKDFKISYGLPSFLNSSAYSLLDSFIIGTLLITSLNENTSPKSYLYFFQASP